MRILQVGDLHYDMRQFDWVVSQADEFDLVVLVGDLLDISSVVALEAQIPVVLGYLRSLADRTRTIVCSGNHDLTGRDEAGEKAALWMPKAAKAGVLTDYGSTFVGDTLISVCPWWDGPVGRERVATFLASEAERDRERWIWVYHWPPTDTPVCWTGREFYGDQDLTSWITTFEPTMVLTGHVHDAPWVTDGSWVAQTANGTWVTNAGRQIGDIPSHVIIDLDDWAASFWSFEKSDERSLATAAG